MAQFLALKAAHPGFLLFYRMGDFYELFFDDAVTAAEILGIALTKRGKHAGDDIPMCGVPVHSAERYMNDLVRAGYRVAVAEQMEDPAEAKKRGYKAVVKRDVVRLVTVGTLTEEALLDGAQHNYLAAFADHPGASAIAWLDLSTGHLRCAQCDESSLATELARISPKEVLVRDPPSPELCRLIEEANALPTALAAASFRPASADAKARAFFGVASLDAFGTFTQAEISAIGALIDYLAITQPGQKPHLMPPRREVNGGAMRIDAATRRNLELVEALSGGRDGTLLSVIDHTVTAGGARALIDRLSAPMTSPTAINAALDSVQFFTHERELREDLRRILKSAPDFERSLSRLHLRRGSPRDLAALKHGLAVSVAVAVALEPSQAILPGNLCAIPTDLCGHEMLQARLQSALSDAPPLRLSDGGAIAAGFDSELDETRALRDQSKQVVADLQTKYQALSAVGALKIKHNNMLGYFIETPASYARKMMSEPLSATFIHRQTMANAVRFTTTELAELEGKIARAGDRAAALEKRIFDGLVDEVAAAAPRIMAAAAALAELDMAAALAALAERERWSRPVVDDSRIFAVEGGRHPVVEATMRRLGDGSFVPNTCNLSADPPDATPLWLVTGPNMAGKSTFLRQNALIAVLAQMGSYVPADIAHIGVVHQLFSRVGASDDLARGRSTFMVEMVETAAILNQADDRALVILDEIGRGTATYDGLAIAWATLEHLEDVNRCRALFATHYHELTTLAAARPAMKNVTVAVKEWNGAVVFLREIRAGAADRSYGVQVATLAGLPALVTARARALLERLESSDDGPAARAASLVADLPLFSAVKQQEPQQEPVSVPSAVDTALAAIEPDDLSPREALAALYKLKEAAQCEKAQCEKA
jgi:DNA mismatch repair protein MutS